MTVGHDGTTYYIISTYRAFLLSPFPPHHHHQAITREALRREVRRFFLDVTPANASLTIPEDASLSQMFRIVYGSSASPARFIKVLGEARDY